MKRPSQIVITEESREEDVSFNMRSNIFGGVQSPIQRLGGGMGGFDGSGLVVSGSYDRQQSLILKGLNADDSLGFVESTSNPLRIID